MCVKVNVPVCKNGSNLTRAPASKLDFIVSHGMTECKDGITVCESECYHVREWVNLNLCSC